MARNFGDVHTNYFQRDASIIDPTDPRPTTVCAWANFDGLPTGSDNFTFLTNNFAATAPRLLVGLRISSGTRMYIYSSGYTHSDAITVSTGVWTHFAWTWARDDTAEFFMDGVSQGTGTRTAGGTATDGAAIGTYTGANNAFKIDGALAEFAMARRLLSRSEIVRLAARERPPDVIGDAIVAYLPLDHGVDDPWDTIHGSWTENGTVTGQVHPHMKAPARRRVYMPVAAAAAGGYSGGLTLAGVGT